MAPLSHLVSLLVVEVGAAIPHQLDGDGENQEAEALVDGARGDAPRV